MAPITSAKTKRKRWSLLLIQSLSCLHCGSVVLTENKKMQVSHSLQALMCMTISNQGGKGRGNWESSASSSVHWISNILINKLKSMFNLNISLIKLHLNTSCLAFISHNRYSNRTGAGFGIS